MECNFVIGQKVVCIRNDWIWPNGCQAPITETVPVLNGIYTIRSIRPNSKFPGIYLRFNEIRNTPRQYGGEITEVEFVTLGFKPLVLKGMEVLNKLLQPTPELVD